MTEEKVTDASLAEKKNTESNRDSNPHLNMYDLLKLQLLHGEVPQP